MVLYRLCYHDNIWGLARGIYYLSIFPCIPEFTGSCHIQFAIRVSAHFAVANVKNWSPSQPSFVKSELFTVAKLSSFIPVPRPASQKSHIDQAPVLVRGEKKVINDDPEWKTNKFISELLFASIRIKTNLRWWTFGRMTQFHDVDAKLVLKRRERKATLT